MEDDELIQPQPVQILDKINHVMSILQSNVPHADTWYELELVVYKDLLSKGKVKTSEIEDMKSRLNVIFTITLQNCEWYKEYYILVQKNISEAIRFYKEKTKCSLFLATVVTNLIKDNEYVKKHDNDNTNEKRNSI